MYLDLRNSMNARTSLGGTSTVQTQKQIEDLKTKKAQIDVETINRKDKLNSYNSIVSSANLTKDPSKKIFEDSFKKALREDPKFTLARHHLGRLYARMKRYKEARDLLSEVANDRYYNNRVGAYNDMALNFFRMGNSQGAIEAYTQSLRLAPYNVDALDRAQSYYIKEAEEKLQEINSQLEEKVEARTNELEVVVNRLIQANKKFEKHELELSQALDKERELNELKSRFVSMASHEFRTPLSTILSSTSLISRYKREDQDKNRQKHIERIKASVANLTGILNDFLKSFFSSFERTVFKIIGYPSFPCEFWWHYRA